MDFSNLIELMNNAAFLVALVLIYGLVGLGPRSEKRPLGRQLAIGAVLGGFGIAVMLNSFDFGQGVIFDTRSVLLSLSGLFFGWIPVSVAAFLTAAFRIFIGGTGATTGVAVIGSSAAIGLIWGQLRPSVREKASLAELYLLGLVVHLVMMAWFLMLPSPLAMNTIMTMAVPVVLLFPLVTLLLGKLMTYLGRRRRAEEELRESEEKFRSLFRDHSAVKLIVDPTTGEIKDANTAAEQFYGWPLSRLLKMKIQDINTLSIEEVEAEMAQAMAMKRIHFEFRHRTADGSIKDVEVYSSRVKIKGKILLHSVIHDISDRKKTELSLRESEKRWRTYIHGAPYGVFIANREGRYIDVNPAACLITGYDREELLRKTFRDLMPPENLEKGSRHFQRLLEEGSATEEMTFLHKNGEIRHWKVSAIRLSNERFLGFAEDITERKLAEDRVLHSRDLMRYIIEHTNSAVAVHDREMNYLYVSQRYLREYNIEDENIIGRNHYELFPDLPPKFRDAHQRALSGEVSSADRDPHYREDGSVEWTQWECRPWHEEDGSIGGVIVYTRVITDSVLAEKTLRESLEHQRAMIEASPLAIFSVTLEGIVRSWNKAAERIFGWEEEEVLGKMLPIVPENDRETFESICRAVGKGESFSQMELVRLRKDKSMINVSLSAGPIYDQAGHSIGIMAVLEDITQRKESEQLLRENEEKYRSLTNDVLDSSEVGIFILSPDFKVVWINQAIEKYFGLARDSIIGRDKKELIRQTIRKIFEDPETFRKKVFATYQDNSYVESFECHVLADENREERWLQHWSQPIKSGLYAGGRIEHYYDITARKKAEEEKIALESQLIQAQKMESVGRLAGGVAHDFNNMLSLILGYSELAMEKIEPGSPLLSDMEQIQAAAHHSAEITRQLLAFSRKQTIAPSALDLNEKIESLLQMLKRLIGENIQLEWYPGSSIWPIFIDSSQVDQILMNLCINARDAIAEDGSIVIETGTKEFDQEYCRNRIGFVPGEFVMLSISDDGCGMNEETRQMLFEPFFTTKETGKGSGLGLAMVYGIVKQNQGFINVYSEPGRGSTFRLYFPRHGTQVAPAKTPSIIETESGGEETILLVEDEETLLKLTETMLENLGYSVIATESPRDALSLAQDHADKIDLLVTDVVMPELNGRELARRVQAISPRLKTLYISGYTANVIAHQGVLDQDVHFLQKPFSQRELATKVRQVLTG